MPTAAKIMMDARTVSGTGFCRKNDHASRANAAAAKTNPPTKLYCRCAAAERDQSPDGVASDIKHSPRLQNLSVSPAVTEQLSTVKSNSLAPTEISVGSHETGETGQAGDPDQPERVPTRPERGHRRGNGDERRDPAMIGRAGQNDCTGADQADRNRYNTRLYRDPPTRIFEAIPGPA